MRIMFCGDQGCNEKIGVVRHNFESFEVSIEEISADHSGLSFRLNLSIDEVAYFWCSEKSKLHGVELLEKMKYFLQRSPSLSQLTGICQTRLDSFATHLRTYFVVSTCSIEQPSGSLSDSSYVVATNSCLRGSDLNNISSSSNIGNSQSCLNVFQPGKGHSIHEGSLSPRLNTFNNSAVGGLPFLGAGYRGILKRSGDINTDLFVSTSLDVTKPFSDMQSSSKNSHFDECVFKQGNDNLDSNLVHLPCLTSPASYLRSLNLHFPLPQLPSLTPCYCWSPPSTSSFQNIPSPSVLPHMVAESLPMPPLSSFSSSSGSLPFLPKESSLEQSHIPIFDFSSIIPGSAYVSMSSSQQIPTFVPYMADPIVHIPVIGVCSSGPGYLVSAGPAITSSLPPCLLPSRASLTEESLVEKNARETLRMLMASTPTDPQYMKVLNTAQENLAKQGSRSGGMLAVTQGVDTIKSDFCLMGFTSLIEPAVSSECGIGIENGEGFNNRNETDVGKEDVKKESES